MKFVFELTHNEQLQICSSLRTKGQDCGTCPLKIDGEICTLDITNNKTSLRDSVIKLLDIALKEIDTNDYV